MLKFGSPDLFMPRVVLTVQQVEEDDPELWQTSCFNDFWLPGTSFVQPLTKLVNDAIVILIIFCDGKLSFLHHIQAVFSI